MPELQQHEALAQALAGAWRSGGAVALPEAGRAPADMRQAIAVQDRLAELIGGRVAGWKVGAATRAVQLLEGHPRPVLGRIFADRCHPSPARLAAGMYPGARIECEFAFRVVSALPSMAPRDGAAIADAVTLHPAIEIAGSRYAPGTGQRAASTYDGIADNGSGAGAVIGPAVPGWRDLQLETMAIDARIDDSPTIQAYSGAYRCDPLETLVQMMALLQERGLHLAVGDVVLTGSLTLPTPIRAGQTATARFGELAPVSVTLA